MEKGTDGKRPRRWYAVFGLSAAATVDSMESYTMEILWPSMYPTLGLHVSALGPLASITRLVSTLTAPLWGPVADRFSRKWLLVCITGIWGLWTSIIGFIHTFSALLAVRVIACIGLGALWPAALSLLADMFAPKERGRAVGLMTAAGFAGSMLSFVLLPTLANASPEGWRTGFFFIGAASFATGLLLLLVKEPPRGAAEPELAGLVTAENASRFEFRHLGRLVKIKSWYLLVVSESLDTAGFAIICTWAFTWLGNLNLGNSVTLIVGMQFAGVLIGHVLFGWLGDLIDSRFPRYGRVAVGQIGIVVNVLAAVGWLLSGGQRIGLLFFFGLLVGLTESLKMSGSRTPLFQNILPPELRATGRGVVDLVAGLLASAAFALSGFLIRAFGDNVGMMMLILVPLPKALSALIWIPLFRTCPKDIQDLRQSMKERGEALKKQGPSG